MEAGQRRRDGRSSTRAARRLPATPAAINGASGLTALIAACVAATMALLFQAGLFAPYSGLRRTIDSLTLSLPDRASAAEVRSYGACGDICTVAGACRYIVLRGGLHGGQKVTQDVLSAAESCR